MLQGPEYLVCSYHAGSLTLGPGECSTVRLETQVVISAESPRTNVSALVLLPGLRAQLAKCLLASGREILMGAGSRTTSTPAEMLAAVLQCLEVSMAAWC